MRRKQPRFSSKPGKLFCDLSNRITEAKCYLYVSSGTRTCMACVNQMIKLRKQIDAGHGMGYESTPILRIYLTATTGKPGFPEDLQRLFRKDRVWTPATKEERFARVKKWLDVEAPISRKPLADDIEETVLQVPDRPMNPQDTTNQAETKEGPKTKKAIRRRKKKPLWVDTCEACRTKKEIIRWCLCQECLDAEK